MKNFILILSTFVLVTLLVFFYQKSLDKGIDLTSKALEVKNTMNISTEELKYTVEQINEAFGSLKEVSRMSTLLKNNKQELNLVDKGEYFVYTNSDLKFDISLEKRIFSNDKEKTFYVNDNGNLILVFAGMANQSEVNLSLLIDKSKTKCDNTELADILINDILYKCGEIKTEEQNRYMMMCNLEKDNTCLHFEYIVTNIVGKIEESLKVENLILKNIVFNK